MNGINASAELSHASQVDFTQSLKSHLHPRAIPGEHSKLSAAAPSWLYFEASSLAFSRADFAEAFITGDKSAVGLCFGTSG